MLTGVATESLGHPQSEGHCSPRMRDEGTAEAAVDVRCLGVIDSFGDRSSNCSHSTHSSLVSSRRKKITELPIYPRTDIGYDFDREKL